MSRRARLARTFTAALALAWGLPRVWAAWTGLAPDTQAAAALFVAAVVLTVWGVAACLHEHRLTRG